MDRKEVLEHLLEELTKLPNRQLCCEVTADEVRKIADLELDFDPLVDFINADNCLKLKSSEVSENRIQALLYFSLMNEHVGCMMDYHIWNYEDEDTGRFIETAEQIFEVGVYNSLCDLCDVSVEDILEYARSDEQQL